MPHNALAELIFFATLLLTFAGALLARKHTQKARLAEGAAHLKLNKWLVGLSAGTTGNSGFVVTGAVGLGYSYGMYWLLLPLGWLLGDLLFWYFFPARLNALGQKSGANTLTGLITHGVKGRAAGWLAVLAAAVILLGLGGYTTGQWLAGQKFLSGAFGLNGELALGLFGLMIIGYSMLGGFRGSVYTDTLQAFIRLGGTTLALVAVVWVAMNNASAYHINIAAAGPGFLSLTNGNGMVGAAAFALGFAAAALGFGLGQPQMVARYLAGKTPAETQGAWWIYIGFIQFTWVTMTVFGIVLRGVVPGLADPEMGLSVFFSSNLGGVATGLIAADVFATIASTSNGILVAMSQTLVYDIAPRLNLKLPFGLWTLLVGAATMGVSLLLAGSSMVGVALGAISLMGAALAVPVMIKILGWRFSSISLLAAMATGLVAALLWKQLGYAGTFNEAGIGMAAGLTAHWLALRLAR